MRCVIRIVLCSVALFLARAGFPASPPVTGAEPSSAKSQILALVEGERFSEAETMLRLLLSEAELNHGPRSLELARVLDLFVEERLKAGKAGHSETLDMARKAVDIKEGIEGLDPGEVAVSLHSLSLVLYSTGHASAGNRHYGYMLEKREKEFGPDSPDAVTMRNMLALSMLDLGNPGEAKPLLETALAIQRKSTGPSLVLARTLSLLSLCHLKLGDGTAARRESGEAASIYERLLSTDEPRLAVVLADWASLLIREEAHAEARPLLDRALFLWERNQGKEGLFSGRCAAALGEVFQRQGDVAMARANYERALRILDAARDVEDGERAAFLSNLAAFLSLSGEPARAEAFYERSADLYLKSAGPASLDGARALIQKARALARSGNRGAALVSALRADDLVRESLRMVAMALPESRALEMSPVTPSGQDVVLSIAATGPDEAAMRGAMDAVIRNRALVLDEVAARYHVVREVESPGTVRLFDAFTAANRNYARRAVQGVREGTTDSGDLEAPRRAREEAEAALTARSLVFKRSRARSRAGYAEVGSALEPGDALVSFVRFNREEFAGEVPREAVSSYVACVMLPGGKAPAVLSLGEAAAIDDLVNAWKKEAAIAPLSDPAPSEMRYRTAGEALRRRIWDPIAEKVGDAKRVFIVPDGEIHQVSFAALPAGRNQYLLETGPVLHYLSAERDLVAADINDEPGEDMLLVGAASFDDASKDSVADSGPASPIAPSLSWTSPRPFRGSAPGCEDFESVRFAPLPASKREIDDIAGIWKDSKDLTTGASRGVVVLSGAQASEAAFKRSAPGMKILHLATHGFVLGGDCRPGGAGTRGIGRMSSDSLHSVPKADESPLRLSGLVLAGANHRSSAGPEDEDGILTAEEIAALDLSGVQWAVLSACDTGLGEVRTGEGVFGLRRAFEAAGVETLIMSLWAADDEASSRWMKNLYEARLTKKLDTARSVQFASLRALRDRRRSKESTHPFFWGGFVAVGDWR